MTEDIHVYAMRSELAGVKYILRSSKLSSIYYIQLPRHTSNSTKMFA